MLSRPGGMTWDTRGGDRPPPAVPSNRSPVVVSSIVYSMGSVHEVVITAFTPVVYDASMAWATGLDIAYLNRPAQTREMQSRGDIRQRGLQVGVGNAARHRASMA